MSDLIIGGLLGLIAGFFLLLFVIGLGVIIYFVMNRDYKYKIIIRNMTGGKAVKEIHKGKKLNHPRLGECYYIPSLKSEKRHLLPYHGSNYEYPLSGKKKCITFTYFNGEYTPEEYSPESMEITKDIIISVANLTVDELKAFTAEQLKDEFVKVSRKIKIFILRPVNKAIRKWVLDADRVINEEQELRLSWFERNKDFIMLTVMCLIAGVVCFMMILFSAQYATTLVTNPAQTPAWVVDLLNASITGANVPPTLG